MILGEFSIWYVENGQGSDGESGDKRKDKAEEDSDEKSGIWSRHKLESLDWFDRLDWFDNLRCSNG